MRSPGKRNPTPHARRSGQTSQNILRMFPTRWLPAPDLRNATHDQIRLCIMLPLYLICVGGLPDTIRQVLS